MCAWANACDASVWRSFRPAANATANACSMYGTASDIDPPITAIALLTDEGVEVRVDVRLGLLQLERAVDELLAREPRRPTAENRHPRARSAPAPP